MKEEDAKKKMCPKLMAAAIAGNVNPDDVIYTDLVLCKASGCMMWQPVRVWRENDDDDGLHINNEGGDCVLKHKTYSIVGNVEISE